MASQNDTADYLAQLPEYFLEAMLTENLDALRKISDFVLQLNEGRIPLAKGLRQLAGEAIATLHALSGSFAELQQEEDHLKHQFMLEAEGILLTSNPFSDLSPSTPPQQAKPSLQPFTQTEFTDSVRVFLLRRVI